MVKERPILFSAPMVRAILDNDKSQTRRIVKPRSAEMIALLMDYQKPWDDPEDTLRQILFECPYGKPGDRLWVRETWGLYHRIHWHDLGWEDQGLASFKIAEARKLVKDGGIGLSLSRESHSLIYAADGYEREGEDGPWKPSIYMPRWASRILLEVISVRVERLQAITEADAIAEGCVMGEDGLPAEIPHSSGIGEVGWDCAKDWYADLWEDLNGEESWETNPWVWVVEFKLIEGEANR